MTEYQLLLLNNLFNQSETKDFLPDITKSCTVEEILDHIGRREDAPWTSIYDAIRNDPELLNLTMAYPNYETDTEAKMACFVDTNGQAYAVFSGTGRGEWGDNADAATKVESEQQRKAREWFERLPYDDIIVTGHSKGGNKAMYVTITTDKVKECYAFDAQGFSRQFCEEYEDIINERAGKIHLTAHARDFVSILLICIAGDVKFVGNSDFLSNPQDYHEAWALLTYENGTVTGVANESVQQDHLMEFFHDFICYIQRQGNSAEVKLIMRVIGELMVKYIGGDVASARQDILDLFGPEAGEAILRYLTQYLRELKKNNPKMYFKYREALGNFANSTQASSDNPFVATMISLAGFPFLDGFLIDNIENGNALRMYQSGKAFCHGQNVKERDFAEKTRIQLINLAKETEEEAWWDITKWDCWYRIEQLQGQLTWDRYTGRLDEYYRKLIDINDASAADIERIFEKVYSIDSQYAREMNGYGAELQNAISRLSEISASIRPGVE